MIWLPTYLCIFFIPFSLLNLKRVKSLPFQTPDIERSLSLEYPSHRSFYNGRVLLLLQILAHMSLPQRLSYLEQCIHFAHSLTHWAFKVCSWHSLRVTFLVCFIIDRLYTCGYTYLRVLALTLAHTHVFIPSAQRHIYHPSTSNKIQQAASAQKNLAWKNELLV